jgi:hypothetical protein
MTISGEKPSNSFVWKLVTSVPLWVFLLTFIVLAIHPIPECVDCEYPHPWGRNEVAFARDSILIAVWLVIASFLAGFWGLKGKWLIPASILVAHLATQPIGGVALWSLVSNEGPMILLLGIPVGAASLLIGHLVRRGVGQMRVHARPS